MLKTADFDTTTSESVQFWHTFEEGWNAGTITFKVMWTAAGGSAAETIDFDLAGRSYANSDVIDQAMGTAQNNTDALITTNDIHIPDSFSSAITIGGTPADAQPNVFKLSRDISDNLAADAKIIGIIIRYTTTDQGST